MGCLVDIFNSFDPSESRLRRIRVSEARGGRARFGITVAKKTFCQFRFLAAGLEAAKKS